MWLVAAGQHTVLYRTAQLWRTSITAEGCTEDTVLSLHLIMIFNNLF